MPENSSPRRQALPSLKDAEWLERPETRKVFDALSAPGVASRAVGGAVRNALLGIEVKDVDLATTAIPDKVMTLARKAGLKAVPTGIEHGTVTVVADGVPFEVTTLRRDIETFGRHATVSFTEDWEEDAHRRDFTVNALYADRDGTVFDPLGGYADLTAGRIRFIGDAEARIREDYLRILRFFRLNAYYGRGAFDQAGLDASVRLRAGLEQLSAERVAAELRRLLIAPEAMRGIEALYDYGLLTEVLAAVPRIERLAKLIAIETAHGLQPEAALRLAALAVFVREDAGRLAARLHLSNAEQAILEFGSSETIVQGLPDEDAAKRGLYALGPSNFRSAVLIAWAESRDPPEDAKWRQAYTLPERWQAPAFPVRGADILACDVTGPEVGEILGRLERAWIDSGFSATREELLARIASASRTAPKQAR